MELTELKAKVYDLMRERGVLVLQAQAIEKEVEQLSAQIAEKENEKPTDPDTTTDEL